MKVIDINSKNSLQGAASVFEEGGILVFPTDTVYGIGCLMDGETIRQLYKIKNRLFNQPTAILMNKNVYLNRSSEKSYAVIPDNMQKYFLGGQVTMVISVNKFTMHFPRMIIKNGKVGIRLPQYPWLEKIIDKVGPIVASSANKKGERPPTKFEAIDNGIIKQVNLAVRTDIKIFGKPSCVYDIELGKYIR